MFFLSFFLFSSGFSAVFLPQSFVCLLWHVFVLFLLYLVYFALGVSSATLVPLTFLRGWYPLPFNMSDPMSFTNSVTKGSLELITNDKNERNKNEFSLVGKILSDKILNFNVVKNIL